jgi:hypothetical protein
VKLQADDLFGRRRSIKPRSTSRTKAARRTFAAIRRTKVFSMLLAFTWSGSPPSAASWKRDYRYSNTLGWNTFPVPTLTEKEQGRSHALRGGHLAGAGASLPGDHRRPVRPRAMPADLRAAHDRNDEVLERIYIGRRFKNDTERLEKLFDLYTKMTASAAPAKGKKRKAGANA